MSTQSGHPDRQLIPFLSGKSRLILLFAGSEARKILSDIFIVL